MKQTSINIYVNLALFLTTTLLNFYLTPYILKNVSIEVYGYYQLANTMILYLNVLTLAINSTLNRFVSINYHVFQFDKANNYIQSSLFLFLSFSGIVLFLYLFTNPCLFTILQVNTLYLKDVNLTFFFVILSFLISMITSILNVSYFLKNRQDIYGLVNLISVIFKALLTLVLFSLFKANVFFIPISLALSNLVSLTFTYWYAINSTKELSFIPSRRGILSAFELAKQGIWNSILALGNILYDGLDLLITNVFFGASTMGIVSIAKIIPGILNSLLSTLFTTLNPKIFEVYAKNENYTKNQVKFNAYIIVILGSIPLSCFLVFGTEFLGLWIPNQNINEIWILSILSLGNSVFLGTVWCFETVFSLRNRLKEPAIVNLLFSTISFIIVLLLLNTTKLGVFAIVGTSSFLNIIKNLIYTIPRTSKLLSIKTRYFYNILGFSSLSIILSTVVYLLVSIILSSIGWIYLIIKCAIGGVISLLLILLINYRKLISEESEIAKNAI